MDYEATRRDRDKSKQDWLALNTTQFSQEGKEDLGGL